MESLIIDVPFVRLPSGQFVSDKRDIVKILPAPLTTFVKWKLNRDGTTLSIVSFKTDSNLTADNSMWFPIDFTYISQ